MPGYALAIDYGTSSTVAMLRAPDGRGRQLLVDGSSILPSAVYAAAGRRLLVGREAERSARLDPARFESNPKRRIDDHEILLGPDTFTVVEVIAATLRRVMEQAVRAAGELPAEVVLTYPASWGRSRQAILREAAGQAGITGARLLPEPVAAGLYFAAISRRVPAGRYLLVYDLGAGTLDITLLRGGDTGFDVTAVAGLADFGGLDLDALVVAQIGAAISESAPDEWRRLTDPQSTGDRRHMRTLWDDARAAKESLSTQASTGIFVPIVDRDFTVSRESLDRAAAPLLVRTAELAARTLADAKVRPADLEAVLLVGGATRMPLVGTVLHRLTGVAPTVSDQPELLVAEGALYTSGAQPEDLPAPVPPTTSTPVAPVVPPAPSGSLTAPQIFPAAPQVPPAPPVPPALQVPGQPQTFPAAPPVLPAPVRGSAPVQGTRVPPSPVPDQPGSTYQAAGEPRSRFHASNSLVRQKVLTLVVYAVVLVVLAATSGAPGPPVAAIMVMLVVAPIVYVRLRVRTLLGLDSWGVHLGRLLLPWEGLVALEIRDDALWAWPAPGAAVMQKRAVRRRWHKKYQALRLIPIGSLDATPDEIDRAIRRYRPDWFAGSSPAYFI
jgi:hypothetical protein